MKNNADFIKIHQITDYFKDFSEIGNYSYNEEVMKALITTELLAKEFFEKD